MSKPVDKIEKEARFRFFIFGNHPIPHIIFYSMFFFAAFYFTKCGEHSAAIEPLLAQKNLEIGAAEVIANNQIFIVERKLFEVKHTEKNQYNIMQAEVNEIGWTTKPMPNSTVQKTIFTYTLSHNSPDIPQDTSIYNGTAYAFFSLKKDEWIYLGIDYQNNDLSKYKRILETD